VAQDRDAVSATVTAATGSLAAQVSTALESLRGALDSAAEIAEARSKTNRPGLDYERDLADALGVIAANAGDAGATFVGGTTGQAGSKNGDVLVTFADGRGGLIAEAKLRAGNSALSVAAWARELRLSRANRPGATVGLGVTRPELMPVPGQRPSRPGSARSRDGGRRRRCRSSVAPFPFRGRRAWSAVLTVTARSCQGSRSYVGEPASPCRPRGDVLLRN
jgi:hypothetical protein